MSDKGPEWAEPREPVNVKARWRSCDMAVEEFDDGFHWTVTWTDHGEASVGTGVANGVCGTAELAHRAAKNHATAHWAVVCGNEVELVDKSAGKGS